MCAPRARRRHRKGERVIEIGGGYVVLGNHPDEEFSEVSKVLIDTNVAADLTNFYFGEQRTDKDSLRKLLLMFPKAKLPGMRQVGISSGMAEQETLWGRLGELSSYRASRARQIRHAMKQIVTWTPEEIEARFAHRHPPVNRDKSWPSPLITEADRGEHPLSVLIVTYAHLLYIAHLYRTTGQWKHNNLGRTWPIRALRDWGKDTFGWMGGYELAMAVTMFMDKGVPSGRIERLLKLNDQHDDPDAVADNVWNATWDVSFVRTADRLTYGLLPVKPEKTCVIARDKDTKFVRAVNEIKVIIDNGRDMPVAAAFSTWSENLKEAEQLQELLDLNLLEGHYRNQRDPAVVLQQALGALDDLEAQMGIQRRTVDAYRRFGGDVPAA